ncbi:MAG: hypothetical protein RSA89_05040 [Raoultibacter sp.]
MSQKKSQKAASQQQKQPKRRTVRRRWPKRVLLALLMAVIVVAAAFSWHRWLRFDDATDIQGTWQLSPATMTVVINDEKVKLTQDVAYAYTLNTWAKTIQFSFGNLTGSGLYEFSADRTTLVIVEGRQPDIASVLGVADMKKEIGEMLAGDASGGATDATDVTAAADATAATDSAPLAGRSVFVKISHATDGEPTMLAAP